MWMDRVQVGLTLGRSSSVDQFDCDVQNRNVMQTSLWQRVVFDVAWIRIARDGNRQWKNGRTDLINGNLSEAYVNCK